MKFLAPAGQLCIRTPLIKLCYTVPLRVDRGEGTFAAGAGKSSGNDISYFGDKGLDDDKWC